MQVLFLTPYPRDTAPSQRFRFELFYELLKDQGIAFETKSFWDEQGWNLLYEQDRIITKLWSLITAFGRRKWLMLNLGSYDFIFVHREVAPVGPPIFEWYISKILKKKVIYDFDDAIWLANTSEQNSLAGRLKWHGKVRNVCRWSRKVSVGNEYLGEFAWQYNERVKILPTIVDTAVHRPMAQQTTNSNQRPTIGWTGSHSTLKYLLPLLPLLQSLEKEYDFIFMVIADRDPRPDLKNYHFVRWSKDKEIEDLNLIDMGIMPLENDQWSKGKCGFKAIQYGAIGIPALVSPVGVNTQIVEHEITGFHCHTEKDWISALKKLLADEDLRSKMGRAGRQRIKQRYSLESQKQAFLQLFD